MNKTKTHTPSSRVGITIERIVEMDKSGVDHDVIALQMQKNSGTSFTSSDITAYCKIYKVTKTKSPITKKQTKALIDDQKQNGKKRSTLKIA